MSGDAFAEKLEWFKRNEKPEVVLLIADDPQLIRIAVAWTNTAPRIPRPRGRGTVKRRGDVKDPGGLSEVELWDWLCPSACSGHRELVERWEQARYSRRELFEKSSVSEYEFSDRMRTLVGNRVLYPDGSINSYVQRYLREKVVKLFEAKPKRTAKKKG